MDTDAELLAVFGSDLGLLTCTWLVRTAPPLGTHLDDHRQRRRAAAGRVGRLQLTVAVDEWDVHVPAPGVTETTVVPAGTGLGQRDGAGSAGPPLETRAV